MNLVLWVLLWGTALCGVRPEGPWLLVKTAEMRDSTGALGPQGRPLSLAGVQGCGGDKEEPMSSLSEAPLQGQGRVVGGSARPSNFCSPFTFLPVY